MGKEVDQEFGESEHELKSVSGKRKEKWHEHLMTLHGDDSNISRNTSSTEI